MIESNKSIQIDKYFNLHFIESRKFKTDLVGLYFLRPLTREEATLNTLLTRVLERGCEAYPTSTLLVRELDSHYGMSFVSDVAKVGERHQIHIKFQFPRSAVIQEDLLAESFRLLNEVVFKPLLENGVFKTSIFETERQKLIQEIESKINDKTTYAIDRCIEEMCDSEPYRFYAYGDVDYLNTVTPSQLHEHYLDVIQNSQMDMVLLGDFDFDKTEAMVRAQFKGPRSAIAVPEEKIVREVNEVRRIEEQMMINQAKLVIGYRTNTDRFDSEYYALQLYSVILGGMPSSKLFMRVRERESLCYFIGSKLDKLKGIMYTMVGLDTEKVERAIEIIEEEMIEMSKGAFTEDEFSMAKLAINASLKSVSDFPNTFANFFYNQFMLNDSVSLEEHINAFEAVTREQIMDVSKRIVKDTVYLLKGSDQNE